MNDGQYIGNRGGKVGRPKKYAQPWVSVAKRVYLEAETFSALRSFKTQKHFISDDAIVQYLINHHECMCIVEWLVFKYIAKEVVMRAILGLLY